MAVHCKCNYFFRLLKSLSFDMQASYLIYGLIDNEDPYMSGVKFSEDPTFYRA